MKQDIITITSRQNETIKETAKLKQSKYRLNSGTVLLEGERLITDAINSGVNLISLFFVKDKKRLIDDLETNQRTQTDFDANQKFKPNFQYAFNANRQISDKCLFYEVTPQVMEVLSSTVTPSGVMAVAKLEESIFNVPSGHFLVLDRIADAGNLGTIVRTAAACGISDIYCINCVDCFNDKAIRASMGTIFKVRVMCATEEQVISLIDKNKLALLVADMRGISVFKYKPPSSVLGLVIGSEAHGVSDILKKACSETVSLPMLNKVESLNAAVSASVLMYQLFMSK